MDNSNKKEPTKDSHGMLPDGEPINTDGDKPQRYESYLLGEDEKKIEEKLDTRMPNTSIFKVNKEDHTMGNLVRSKLLTNSHVVFAGYRVPHPLFPTFDLRVQTDGEITPKEAVLAACRELVKELGQLSREFAREYQLRKLVGQSQNGGQ